jgi:hypothetical protein
MRFFSFASFIFLSLLACNKPQETIEVSNNPFSLQPANYKQNILVEQFVSESRFSSLDAEAFLHTLTLKNKAIIPISLHKNDWLELPYNQYLANFYGGVLQFPCGAVNRHLGLNTNVSLTDSLVWVENNFYENLMYKLNGDAPLAISLHSTISTNGEKTNLSVYIAHKVNFNDDLRLSIYLVQDEMKAIFQQGSDSNYIHKNILREVVSEYEGNKISISEKDKNGLIDSFQFNDIDIKNYDLSKMKIVVIVHKYSLNYKEAQVINAQSVRLGGNKYWD